MTVTLRPARPLDAGPLGKMLTEAVHAFDWKPQLHSAAEDIAHVAQMIGRGWVTVACDGDAPRGFIARDRCYVHALFIAETARGSGIGRALIADAQKAVDLLELWTFQHNLAAQRFYARLGFAVVERTDGRDNDERLPDIRFVWQRGNRSARSFQTEDQSI